MVPCAAIPGMEHLSDEDSEPDQDMDHKIKTILQKLRADQAAWPFLKPVDSEEVPEYYDFIKYPMDLKTMTDRYKQKYYVHVRMLVFYVNDKNHFNFKI